MKRIERYIQTHLDEMENRQVIVTGANSGIGFSICDVMLQKHAHVIMACRNEQRAIEAKNALLSRHPDGLVDIIIFDQSSLASISHFAHLLMNEYSSFFALILNAGVFRPCKDSLFEEEVPLTIGTNFIGPLYLIELLHDYLRTVKEEKRIIFQGSLAFHLNHYHGKERSLLSKKNGLMKQYNLSKLGITRLFQYCYSHNENSHVKYLLAEPGVSNTQIIRNFQKWFKTIASGFLNLFTHSNLKASLSACYLACEKVSNGDYVHPRGLLSIMGFPHYAILKEKHLDYRIVDDAKEIIRGFHE